MWNLRCKHDSWAFMKRYIRATNFINRILLEDLSRVRWSGVVTLPMLDCAWITQKKLWWAGRYEISRYQLQCAVCDNSKSNFRTSISSSWCLHDQSLAVANQEQDPNCDGNQSNPKMAGILCHVHVHDTRPRLWLNLMRVFDSRAVHTRPREFFDGLELSPTRPVT